MIVIETHVIGPERGHKAALRMDVSLFTVRSENKILNAGRVKVHSTSLSIFIYIYIHYSVLTSRGNQFSLWRYSEPVGYNKSYTDNKVGTRNTTKKYVSGTSN